MQCWIVNAATGEYSDRREWPIMVYTDEAAAKQAVLNLDQLARALGIHETSTNFGNEVGDEIVQRWSHVFKCDAIDYTGLRLFYSGPVDLNGIIPRSITEEAHAASGSERGTGEDPA